MSLNMPSVYQIASFGRPLELANNDKLESMGNLRISLAKGRGAQINADPQMLSIWFIERGCAYATTSAMQVSLCEGQMLVNVDASIRLVSIGDAAWIGLSLPMSTACQMLSASHTSKMALQTLIDETPCDISMQNRKVLQHANAYAAVDEEHFLGAVDTLFGLEDRAQNELNNCPGRTDQLRRLSHQRLSKVRAYIAANPQHVTAISELAAMANYSGSHFIRTFSKAFKESPMEFAHRLRMSNAKHLISAGRLSLREISRQVGFVNFSAFCRSFRMETGYTPTAFKDSQARLAG